MEMSMRKRPRPQQFTAQQFNQASGKRPRQNGMPQEFRNQQLNQASRYQPHHYVVSYVARPPTMSGAIQGGTMNVMPNGVPYGSYNIATILSAFATLLAQGEYGAPFFQVFLNNLTPDMLADIVIANMVHLPSSRDPGAILYLQTYDSSVIVKQELVAVPERMNISNRVVMQEPVEVESMNISDRVVKQEPLEVERINISNQVVKQEPVEVESMNISDRVVKQEPLEVERINISDRVVPQSGKSLANRVQISRDKKTALCVASLVRILEKHKTITAYGGGELRSGLLARLATEITEFLKILERHILADYEAHKGHELGLHILYQLYADQATIYEQFLLSLAQGLQEKSKALSRFLSEVPEVSMTTLKLVEELCVADSSGQVTAGLTALWAIILERPTLRDTCLKLVLKCTVHESENIRGKAVRLVANKLYQLHYVAQSIEDFATSSFYSVVNHPSKSLEGSNNEKPADGAPIDEDEARMAKSTSEASLSLPEAQQSMALFFGLCTKKHALFRQLVQVYGEAPKAVKQAIDQHMPLLVRTVGSSSQELLQLIADPPPGSENLVKQIQTVLQSTPRE